MELAGALIVLLGSIIFLVSSIGLVRMPDIFNRIQVSTKSTTLGTILVLLGIGFLHPIWFPKLGVIILFIILTNPVSSHVIARAAYFGKEKMTGNKDGVQLSAEGENRDA